MPISGKKRSASLTETLLPAHPHRPKTLKKAREPKYARKSVASVQKLDQFQVLARLIPRDLGIARA